MKQSHSLNYLNLDLFIHIVKQFNKAKIGLSKALNEPKFVNTLTNQISCIKRLAWLNLMLISSPLCAAEIQLATHEIRPLSWQDNLTFKGLSIDIVNQIAKVTGDQLAIIQQPFNRSLQEVELNKMTAHFPVARRPEREHKFKWVGPIGSEGIYFYQLSKNTTEIDNLHTLKKQKLICVGRGNADHLYLQSQGFNNLYPVRKAQQCLSMLEAGRVNVSPFGEIVMIEMAKNTHLSASLFKKTQIKLYQSDLYIAFSNATPNNTIVRWQSALTQVKTTEQYQQIVQKYLHE